MLMIFLLTSLIAFFAQAGQADAGPVFFAVLSAGGGFGAAFGATALGGFLTTTMVGRLLASVAISALQAAMAPKPKSAGITTDATTTGGTNPCGFVLGLTATAGDAVCPMMSHGKVGKTPNAYLTYVVALGDIPGQTLTRVAIDGSFVSFDPTADHGDYGAGIGGKYRGYAWVKYYDGSQTAADPMLLSRYGDYPARPWKSDMIGTGIPYAICTFRYNRDLFQGLPAMLFECGGIKLYDPRYDSTAGGTGAHRWGQPSTYSATTNPAVMAFNIKRGITLPGLGTWGGRIEAEDLPTANWFAAMNRCEVLVGSPTVRQFRAGIEVKVDMEPASIIEELMKACTGQIAEVGGTFKIRVGGPGLPVMFITDDDLIVTKSQDFAPFPQADQRQNGIDAQYPEPSTVWQTKSAPSIYNAAWEAEDGDRRVVSLELPACPYPMQVQQIMQSYINDERRFRKHGITLTPDAAVLEPLDAISWTSARNGYDAKLFELSEVVDDPKTILQRIALRECDSADYAWSSANQVAAFMPSAEFVAAPSQRLVTCTATPIAVTDGAGTARRPAIRMGWDGTELDAVDAVQYEVRVKNGAMVGTGSTVDVAAGEFIRAEGIIGGVTYQTRYKPIAIGRATEWTDWIDVTSLDVRLGTPDLSDALNTTITNVVAKADANLVQLTAAQAQLTALQSSTTASIAAAQSDIIKLKSISRAGLNGWVKDPTFADWTSGNLTAANWAFRSGTGTVGTQLSGDFGGGIYINASAGAAQTYVYADTTAGLVGADPDAPYVVVSVLMEWLAGSTNAVIKVGWSADGSTWTYAATNQLLTDYALAVKTGPHQYVERMLKRPAGSFTKMRLEVFFKTSALGAQEQKWHLLNLRAATEAEILAGNVPTMQSDITTIQTTASTLAGTVASQNTTLTSAINAAGAASFPSDFNNDGAFWTDQVAGNPQTVPSLGAPWSFASVADGGKVAQLNDLTTVSYDYLMARHVIVPVAGRTYRLTVTARKVGSVAGPNHIALHMRRLNGSYDYIGSSGVFSSFALTDSFAEYTAEYTALPTDVLLRHGLYRFNTAQGSGRIEVKSVAIKDITDTAAINAALSTNYLTSAQTNAAISSLNTNLSATIAGNAATAANAASAAQSAANTVSANLSNNYLTSAQTNAAIASVQTSLGASIGSAQGTIDQIKALNISGSSAFGTLMSQLQVDAGGTSAKITQTASAVATIEGNSALTYSLKVGSAGMSIVETNNPNGPISVAKIAAQHLEITAESMRITGGVGAALNLDPNFQDVSAWSGASAPTIVTISDGVAGDRALRGTGNLSIESKKFAVNPNKKFRLRGNYRKSTNATGTSYFRFVWYNAAGTLISYSHATVPTATTSWQEVILKDVAPPSTARFAAIRIILNQGNSSPDYHEWQGVSVEEQLDATMFIEGALAVTGMAIFGNTLQSSNYVAGVAGWRLTNAGDIEANSLAVRSSMIVDGRTLVTYDADIDTRLDVANGTTQTLATITMPSHSGRTTAKVGITASRYNFTAASFDWVLSSWPNTTYISGGTTLASGTISIPSGYGAPSSFTQSGVGFDARRLPLGSSVRLRVTNVIGVCDITGGLSVEQIKNVAGR